MGYVITTIGYSYMRYFRLPMVGQLFMADQGILTLFLLLSDLANYPDVLLVRHFMYEPILMSSSTYISLNLQQEGYHINSLVGFINSTQHQYVPVSSCQIFILQAYFYISMIFLVLSRSIKPSVGMVQATAKLSLGTASYATSFDPSPYRPMPHLSIRSLLRVAWQSRL